MDPFERITWNGHDLAYIIRASLRQSETTFVTPNQATLQVGFVVYPAGGRIAAHIHPRIKRQVNGTSEVLVVKAGRCEVDLYDSDKLYVTTRELCCGDVLVILGGGHGFRMLEDTVLLEIKQGPYFGPQETERF